MGTSADHDKLIVSHTGNPIYGQTDGIGVVPDAGGSASAHDGLVAISNGDVSMTLDRSMYCEVFEDFIGDRLIAETGSKDVDAGPWTYKDVSSSGSPTAAIVANADNGQWAFTFASTTEAEELVLYWDDELNIDSDQEPVFIIRFKTACAVGGAFDSNTHFVAGLASAYNTTTDTIAQNAWIRLEGANNNILLESDDNTTNTDDQDSGVDYVDDTFYEFMVSMSALHGASATDVRFFYRSTLGGDWTALTVAGVTFKVAADTALQPFMKLMKASDANTDGVVIDYVRVYWKRN